jgi:hypothetical protein
VNSRAQLKKPPSLNHKAREKNAGRGRRTEGMVLECVGRAYDHDLPFEDVVFLETSRETLNRIFLELCQGGTKKMRN